LNFLDRFSKKKSQILNKFYENPSGESRVVSGSQKDGPTDGQTERHDEINSHFSPFCETRLKLALKRDREACTIYSITMDSRTRSQLCRLCVIEWKNGSALWFCAYEIWDIAIFYTLLW